MLGISYAALIVSQCFGDWRDGCGLQFSLLQITIIALQIGATVAAMVLSRPVPIVTRNTGVVAASNVPLTKPPKTKFFNVFS